MLDIVKLRRQGRKEYDSLASIDRFLVGCDIARFIDIEGSIVDSVISSYKQDDWDILISEDEQDIHALLAKDYAVYSSFPIIRQQNASGVSIGGEFIKGASWACREVADMLAATEIWTISKYHRALLLEHYGRFFSNTILTELETKLKVLYLGIEVDKLFEPREVGREGALRIFFPLCPPIPKACISSLE